MLLLFTSQLIKQKFYETILEIVEEKVAHNIAVQTLLFRYNES